MKRLSLSIASVLLLCLCLPGQGIAAKKEFISLGTGGTGGVYYPLGAGMAKIIADKIPNVQCTAEATGASVENLKLLAQDNIQMAMVFANVAYDAVKGQGSFKKPLAIKALFNMYPTPLQLVTEADSGIKSVADFKGKRIGVGSPGSGNEVIARVVLQAYGLTYKDIKPEYLSIGEMMNGIKDGTVDAGLSCTAVPTSSIMDLAYSAKITLIPIPKDKVEEIYKLSPFFTVTTIPTGAYSNVDTPTETASYGNYIMVRDDMSDDLAYTITKAIYENLNVLESAHVIGKQMTLEEAVKCPGVDMHPGALRYWKEIDAIQ